MNTENKMYRAVFGSFDGVHIGHRTLLSYAYNKKQRDNIGTVVYIIYCEKDDMLTSLEERKKIINMYDVDKIETLYLDKIKNMTSSEFFKKYINGKVIECICGENFYFGKNKMASAYDLAKMIDTKILPLYKYDGCVVSSSLIRDYLKNGEIEKANTLLGYNFSYFGIVENGRGVGKKIGYPTSNIKCNKIRIKNGVYKTIITIDGKEYPAITNVGSRPTFGNLDYLVESHILDFDFDIYGKEIECKFVKFIRDEMKFSSVKELENQIKEDISNL